MTPSEPNHKKKVGYAIYTGLLSKEKGVRTLVSAWKHIDYLPLKILGDGPLRGELESEAKKYGLNIEFLGYRSHEEVIKFIQQGSLMVIPSEWYEGLPMVVLEAYQCGTPVVASRIGSLVEIVIDGKTGMLFEPGNAFDLASKVNKMMESPGIAKEMAVNAKALFNEKYTAERNFKILLEIYHDVIEHFVPLGCKKENRI